MNSGSHSSIIPGLLLALLVSLSGCAGNRLALDPPAAVEQQRITELNRAILALGEDVDPEEAGRAARIAIDYSRQLAREYEVTGSPLMHNLMVNLGVKSRGLCVDWTRDLLTRLKQERFHSLQLHWAIANYEAVFRLEHSTVVISTRDASLQQGLVLDPWRNSGELYWSPTLEDTGYVWRPQAEIHALKDRRAEALQNRRVLR